MVCKSKEWRDEFNVGIKDIDMQHRFFVNLINRFTNLFDDSRKLECRKALVSELNAFTNFHFICEENMMSLTGYPDMAEHQQRHREVVEQLSLHTNMLLMRNDEEAEQSLLTFLDEWLENHVKTVDRKFADYLRSLSGFNLS